MSKNSVYGVVLSYEIAKQARIVAALQGMSRSKLIRILVENYLNSTSTRKLFKSGTSGNKVKVLDIEHISEIEGEAPISPNSIIQLRNKDKQPLHKQRL